MHEPGYVERIRGLSAGRGGDAGSEAPFGNGSYEIAALAAGGAIAAVDAVLDGSVDNAYALVRPPGHHALPGLGMGFCIFANVAVAVRHAQAARGVGRIAVVDWDVHHGNGTQAAFWEDGTVLAVSLHQDGCYPGAFRLDRRDRRRSGHRRDAEHPAAGGIRPRCVSRGGRPRRAPRPRAFPPGADRDRLRLRRRSARSVGRMLLSASAFRELTVRLLDASERLCDGRLVASHKGGYSAGHVPFCGLAVIEALSGLSAGIDDPFAYLGEIPGNELQPHQDGAIDIAAANVQRVPS